MIYGKKIGLFGSRPGQSMLFWHVRLSETTNFQINPLYFTALRAKRPLLADIFLFNNIPLTISSVLLSFSTFLVTSVINFSFWRISIVLFFFYCYSAFLYYLNYLFLFFNCRDWMLFIISFLQIKENPSKKPQKIYARFFNHLPDNERL